MTSAISIGKQDFASLRENHYFYVDKTDFIRQWWESGDDITLITRPRRFGKTLNMSMLNCFFSRQYAEKGTIFEGLSIWKQEKYRRLQGTYPVIFLSFADVKQNNYQDAVQKIKNIIVDAYRQHRYLEQEECFTQNEKQQMLEITEKMSDVTAQDALKNLSSYLNLLYGKKVLIFLDEYDTPMQEAYIHGYWDEFVGFMRSLFNATFKTNPYLERAVMTGITRISKESVFSDLNNLTVITTTSDAYASGYLKVEEIEYRGLTLEPWYSLSITNLETVSMFSNMFKSWFAAASANYNEFIKALLNGDVKAMNLYMNDIALATFSNFDAGKHASERSQPERFYHGFVLGLLVEVRDLYEVRSNRESGYGRYDVILIPRNLDRDAMILEFKVKETEEKTLQETVQKALAQIEIKKYDAELKERGIPKERIRHYGFAFEGKKVLIG